MLERTSRFVLEVLPYLSSALIAAVIVPGFLYSHAHGTKPAVTPNVPRGSETTLEIIGREHTLRLSPARCCRPAKMARDRLANR